MGARLAPRAALAGVVLCAAVWVAALVVPAYSSSSTRSVGTTGHGETIQVTSTSHETVVAANGAGVLLILAIPVSIAIVGLLGARGVLPRGFLVAACVLLWIWTMISMLTVGIFYLPAAAALTVALVASDPRRRLAT